MSAHADHPAHLQHHFENSEQQFESSKLGMWLFLGTELLMFGGLFCAYAIYRANHPEIFMYAHHFLDTQLGAINTVVLICSSLTMAWGVRAAQLGQRGLLIVMLLLTLLCAGGFMGIKYVEYSHKISHGLLWGNNFEAQDAHGHGGHGAKHGDEHAADHGEGHAADDGHAAADDHGHAAHDDSHGADGHVTDMVAVEDASAPNVVVVADADAPVIPNAPSGPSGLAAPKPAKDAHAGPGEAPPNPHIFFGIYFAMTGLHGIHVLGGMVVITWLIIGAFRGAYGPEYFTPVDLVGLYWHIVDLIWIFLFPLLYLIH